MPIPETYASLVAHLSDNTNQNKLAWKTPFADTTGRNFYVQIANSTLLLSSREDPLGGDVVAISIQNADGVTIDSFDVSEGDKDFANMSKLRDNVRRRVLRVDETIVDLERALKEMATSEREPSSGDS